ncbi:MAG: dihydrolipoyl dehydrogenase [Leptospiraceae bacterium]|nr:dihydrolipoyl dehydrogenase [Leptospiraceae bacterium]
MDFEVVVIGGGPGGYVAAIRAAQLGFKTAVIEKEKMGGVCLNWGCIPTKALLQSAHLLEEMKKAQEFGISAQGIQVEFGKVIERSRKVADQMAKGVDFLMKKNKIEVVFGTASFIEENKVLVSSGDSKKEITADRFIIATGARSRPLPGLAFDQNLVLSSREAMVEKSAPKKIGVIGAGAIGVEFADFYASMGSEVVIIEYLDHLLPNEDEEISQVLEKSFLKRKIEYKLGMSVYATEKKENSVVLKIKNKNNVSETSEIEVDKVLVGIGLVPNTEDLNLEKFGVVLSKGFIDVNERYATKCKSIYAIGDCTGNPLLAHVASMEGIKAAEAIAIELKKSSELKYHPINYDLIPGCTYCHPEVASFGLTEKKAIALGFDVKVGKFPFTASGRAQAIGDTNGMVKIVTNAKHGEILGAHIIGPSATEIIAELVLASSNELSVHEIIQTIHAHPTISEGVLEATSAVLGEAINI